MINIEGRLNNIAKVTKSALISQFSRSIKKIYFFNDPDVGYRREDGLELLNTINSMDYLVRPNIDGLADMSNLNLKHLMSSLPD
jgi:hypothetical protein